MMCGYFQEGASYDGDMVGMPPNQVDSEDTGSIAGTVPSQRGSVLKRSTTNTNFSLPDSSRKNSIVA